MAGWIDYQDLSGRSPGMVGTYFIAEIGANHDGKLDRALKLIQLAAESGASAVKFQHYKADTLASKVGFDQLQSLAHYSDNPHSVFRRYEVPWGWTPVLADVCRTYKVDFLSTPYDLDAVDHLDPYVKMFKIGSGDSTYHELIKHAASKGKDLCIATGASSFYDIDQVVKLVPMNTVTLMQCNTNYDVDQNKGRHANLEVIRELYGYYPKAVGYSDHTLDYVTALGAVALGATVIEKHFTDDRTGESPDHPFAVEPPQFRDMVSAVRRLEAAMGDGVKTIEDNEKETVVLQRRCLRAARDMEVGTVLTADDLVALRPAPAGSFKPYEEALLLGRTLYRAIKKGEHFER